MEQTESNFYIIDINVIQKLLKGLICPVCNESNLIIKLSQSKQSGMECVLNTVCCTCESHINSVASSKQIGKTSNRSPYEVNRRMVTAFIETGIGFAGMEKFSRIMNMPCLHHKTFNTHAKAVNVASMGVVQNILDEAATFVRKAYTDLQPQLASEAIINICVSYDGSWMTRGHKSRFGVGACIDILTGLCIDFEVMSSYCHVCEMINNELDQDSEEYKAWKEKHASICDVNHTKSSGMMEVEAAEIIWNRSVTRHGFRYLSMLSDGDSKTFNHLNSLHIYGEEHIIEKEECINHVSKRLGTALRKLSTEKKDAGVNLGGKGYGKLTDITIKKLTKYYNNAIHSNKGDLNSMRKAVFATYLHAISSDEDPHHSRCPPGVDSWCFYNRAMAKGETIPPHKGNVGTPLDREVAVHVLPVYQRLGHDNILQRCLQGRTQNANESLHSVIWNGCPKTLFVHKTRVQTAVSLAVSKFNSGARSMEKVLKMMEVQGGSQMEKAGCKKDSFRIIKSVKRKNDKYKLYRRARQLQEVRQAEENRRSEGSSYEPGAF